MRAARVFIGARGLRFTPIVAISMIAASTAAFAECPPPKSEAQHIAAGAVVFTGKVKAIGPTGRTPFPDYADLDVVGTGSVMRVHAPNNGLYTTQFKLGETYRIVAYRGERGLETSLCLFQRP